MDIVTQTRALDLIYKMFFLGKPGFAPAGYIPSKTEMQTGDSEAYFKSSCPERHGISSRHIINFYRELEASEDSNIHTVTILADGEVISAACARPYSRFRWNLSYSFSKTVTALAVGILAGEGKLSLDDPVYKLLPHDAPAIISVRTKSITVRNLLEMSSGVFFNELGVISDEYWSRAFFESSVKFEVGSQFAYNSMNSYMLAAIVKELTGEGLVEFLTPRIFEPMKIRDIFWQKCPRGIEQGGMGLFITPEDMLKIGVLLADNGQWEGRQLVPADFVAEMVKTHMVTPEVAGGFNYGYHTWVSRSGGAFLANGLFGQNVYVTTGGIVIAITAGNSEMFQSGEMMKLTEKYFGNLRRKFRWNPISLFRLRRAERRFWQTRAWLGSVRGDSVLAAEEAWRSLAGRRFAPQKNNIGIIPLTLRIVNGNHSTGITAIGFYERDGVGELVLTEGDNEYTMRVGFADYQVNHLHIGGECYRVSARAAFLRDDDYRRTLKIELAFDETPATRRIKITIEKERLIVALSEVPSERLIEEYINSMTVSMPAKSGGIASKLMPKLDVKIDTGLLPERVLKTFSPVIIAKEIKEEKEEKQNAQP